MRIRQLVAALGLWWVAGCASTSLSDVWRDPGYTGPPLRRLVVFGLSRDFTARRIFEDRFVARLARRQVEPVASYTLLPGETEPTEAQVREAIRSTGADGALLTYLVGVTHRTSVVPGYGAFVGVGPFYPDYLGSWGTVYAPGYLETDTVVRLSTRLYVAAGDGRLVWAGDSDTLNPGSVKSLAGDVIGRVVERLVRDHLIL